MPADTHLTKLLPLSSLFLYIAVSSSVSRPLQSVPSFLPQSRVTASVPENLSLFLDPAPRTEEGPVKKLSKDSILSLYGSTPSLHASSMPTHGQQYSYPRAR